MAVTACPALGQSRKAVGFHDRSISQVGESGGSYTFSTYSFGLGNLQRSSAGPGSGLLQSSIAGPADFSLGGRGGVGGAWPTEGLSSAAPGAGGGRMYKPVSGGMELDPGIPMRPFPTAASALGAVRMYLDTLDLDPDSQLLKRGKPITSLVPAEPSEYQKYMQEGERLFRAGRFAQAFGQFKMASYLVSDDSASLLSMSHAMLAVGSYASSGYYLQEALRYTPELPLAPLRPSAFFGKDEAYKACLQRLRKYTRDFPRDPNGQILLAYLAWFDQDLEQAVACLGEAEKAVKDPEKDKNLAETIDIFRRAMEASGLAGSASKAETTTQPSNLEQPAPKG